MDVVCVECQAMIPGAARQRRRCDMCKAIRARSYSKPIRRLLPGEEPPAVEPRRYLSGHGYVRLRWVTDTEILEAYEHRFVMNAQDGSQVHHRDHVRSNNERSNLAELTPQQHRAEHREIDVEAAAALYADGLGTVRIGKILGHDPSAIFRALRKHGVQLRQGFGGPERKVD